MARLFEMLKEDHDAVKGLLNRSIESKDTSQFSQIRKMLEVHMEGEEKLIYPKLMQRDKERALESYEEHHVGKLILKELDETGRDDEAWIPKMKVLKDVLDHHIEEEESEIFDEARQMLDENQEQQIVRQFEELRSQRM
ncbi:MAG: hemerythrin domain-containing protein [Methanobacterium sp.]